MKLENHFTDQPLFLHLNCNRTMFDPSPCQEISFPLTVEHTLKLRVNGEQVNTFTCSPAQLIELCVGWLTSEGVLSSAEDLLQLTISADGQLADAVIAPHPPVPCTPFSSYVAVDKAQVEKAEQLLYNDTTTHGKTHGTHGCVLVTGDGSAALFEDIGRYNAADKAIGSAVLQGVDMHRCLLYSSGRVPEDMITKMLYCKIPVLVSKAVTTVQALTAAQKNKVTLYFSAKKPHVLCGHDPKESGGTV